MNSYREQRQAILDQMNTHSPDTEEYNKCLNALKLLNEAESKSISFTNPVFVNAAVTIASILVVLNFERAGIVTSKAFNMIKLR